jgi:outer membrane receptor protein involved in Fe transport
MATDNNPSQLFTPGKLSVAVSAACAGVAPNAIAQDADGALRLEEIVVTATKREVSLQDVPMSITAFTDEDVVRAGFKQLDDYVGQIPALSSARREPGGSNVIMRGCATSGVAFQDTQSTAVYLDEQPISVAGFNPDPRLVDIKRVEALSGPQGTLFGDSSQCGTLRIITNKPDTEAFDGWVDLTAMSVAHGDTGFDISAMVNVPFADNKAAVRFVGFIAEEAGYIDNVLTDSPGGEFFPGGTFDNAEFVKDDINESTVTGGRLGLRIAPGDNWKLDLQAAYQDTDAKGFGDVDLPEAFHEGDNLGKWEQARFGDDRWEEEWYQLSLGLEGSLGWGELTVAASFMNRQTRYDADSTAYLAAWQEFYPYDNIYDFGGDPQAMSFDVSDADRTSFEIRLATPSDSDSRWNGVIGAFYNKSEDHTHFSANIRQLGEAEGAYAFYYLNNYSFDECRYDQFDPNYPYYCLTYYDAVSNSHQNAAPSVKWWDGVYNSTLEQVAIFGEATIDFTDHFSLTLGGRWFDIETDRTLENGALIPTSTPFTVQGPEVSCDPTGVFTPTGTEITDQLCWTGVRNVATSDESGFVPKVTATFNATDANMFYATYSEGFRRGGGNAARPTSIFGRAPFNEFESDLVTNYEIGTKNTFADGRFQFNLTLYHMIWDDMQIEVEDPTPNIFTLGLVNVAEAELNGAEAFMAWVPTENMSINASIGYSDAELSKSFTLFADEADDPLTLDKGTPLPLTPDWKASVVLDYEFDRQMLGSTPSLGITYHYTGDSISSLAGIASTEVLNPVRVQDAYSIANIRFGLENDSWAATLFVHNAFDEYARQYYNDRWIQTRLTVNQPRTYGISFRKKFR